MRTDIVFKDFHRSEYIENFLSDKIDHMVERLVAPDNDTHVTVRLEKCKERTDLRRPVFQCEVIVKSGMSSKIYKTVKCDRNIFRAIVCSFDSMKNTLSKTHDRLRHDRRRRKHSPRFEYTSEVETDLQYLIPPSQL
jgi:ribosome-associated translation inhibitor RaiA